MTNGRPFPLIVVFRLRRQTLAAFDYNNIIQGVLDALQAAKYLTVDDMHHVIPIPAPWVNSKDNAGCDIWLAGEEEYKKLVAPIG